jgi:hypothetical protein
LQGFRHRSTALTAFAILLAGLAPGVCLRAQEPQHAEDPPPLADAPGDDEEQFADEQPADDADEDEDGLDDLGIGDDWQAFPMTDGRKLGNRARRR